MTARVFMAPTRRTNERLHWIFSADDNDESREALTSATKTVQALEVVHPEAHGAILMKMVLQEMGVEVTDHERARDD